jgi:hypothetical protein
MDHAASPATPREQVILQVLFTTSARGEAHSGRRSSASQH